MVYLKHRKHSASGRTRYFDLGYKESNDVKQANLELSWAHIVMFLLCYVMFHCYVSFALCQTRNI